MKMFRRGRHSGNELSFRQAGDVARSQMDWETASKSYSKHLEEDPSDFDIWVQYGHAEKEMHHYDTAISAYKKAYEIRQDDNDVATHLAHLLKRVGRSSEARTIFKDLFKRTNSRETFAELNTLAPNDDEYQPIGDELSLAEVNDSIFVELDDLFGYLRVHKTVSGIQRVQIGVINYFFSNHNKEDRKFSCVLNPTNDAFFWRLRDEDLFRITQCVTSPMVDHKDLINLIDAAKDNATIIRPCEGQTLFVLGAFWAYGGSAARYMKLKRAGVKIGAYIYDLIPITHYEYCDEGLPHEFTLSIGDALHIFDFFLTISDFTAKELRRYMERLKLPAKPIRSVRLAHASDDRPSSNSRLWTRQIQKFRGRNFVLMVSTIEARKNHSYLVAAWKAFLDEGLNPPDLVFVGRVGWRVSSLMELLETTHYFDGRIHILNDLSDVELHTLYNSCLFTAFPSFIEGWGLPVGESLANHTPCVASSTSSIPEVGGDFVDYIDPFNLTGGIDVLRRMTFDAAYRNERRKKISSSFKPRKWLEVGADIIQSVEAISSSIETKRNPEPLFRSGSRFKPKELFLGNKLPNDYACNPYRLMISENWYTIENIGAWMKGERGYISFMSDLNSGDDILVYCELYGAPWATNHEVRASVSNGIDEIDQNIENSVMVTIKNSGHFRMLLKGKIGANRLVQIYFQTTGHIPQESEDLEARRFILGISGISYVGANDLVTRLSFIEEMIHDDF